MQLKNVYSIHNNNEKLDESDSDKATRQRSQAASSLSSARQEIPTMKKRRRLRRKDRPGNARHRQQLAVTRKKEGRDSLGYNIPAFVEDPDSR